jgi:hypothetical protein
MVLAHCNNVIYVAPLFRFRANCFLFLLFNDVCLATNTNSIVFGLIWPGLDSTIYRCRGEHVNHYTIDVVHIIWGPSWPWSYGSWIHNYLCNWCLSSLMLWVRLPLRARSTTLCDKVCQWLATGRWFSPGHPVSSADKTDHHDITEILLKVALSTIKPNNIIWYME